MLDISLIRENPELVKAQFVKLQDETAGQRVDTILALDKERRALLQESEVVQQHRNRLNKGIGRLRGDKSLTDDSRAQRAGQVVAALDAGNYEVAVAAMEGTAQDGVAAPVAFETLLAKLAAMGDRVSEFNTRVRDLD